MGKSENRPRDIGGRNGQSSAQCRTISIVLDPTAMRGELFVGELLGAHCNTPVVEDDGTGRLCTLVEGDDVSLFGHVCDGKSVRLSWMERRRVVRTIYDLRLCRTK